MVDNGKQKILVMLVGVSIKSISILKPVFTKFDRFVVLTTRSGTLTTIVTEPSKGCQQNGTSEQLLHVWKCGGIFLRDN